jgi:hypothetical protein
MSSVPNQQLESLLAGGQLLGQASQNQQATFQREAQQRAAGLERRAQDVQLRGQNMQEGMQRRDLQAQAENYQKLNESRERMQGQELAQQQSQFQASQAQDKELRMFDQEIGLEIARAKAKAQQLSAQAIAGQKDDPTLKALRAEKRKMQERARSLEQALNAGREAKGLAGTMRTERGRDVKARLQAYHQAQTTLDKSARKAMSSAVSDVILQNARESGGFMGEAMRAAPFGDMMGVSTQGFGMWKVLGQNLLDATFGLSDEEWTRERMTMTERSPTKFATQVIDKAFEGYDEGLGLKPEQKAAAKEVMVGLIVNGAVLSGVEDELIRRPATGEDKRVAEEARKKVAEGIGKLRSSGMQDTQILAMLGSLEALSEGSSAMVSDQGLAASGIQGDKGAILEKTLRGVGAIVDGIESVTNDEKFMRDLAGGELVDMVKFDMPRVHRMAMQAYAMDQAAPQMQEFQDEARRLGLRDPAQMEEIVQLLIENDPRLKDLGFDLDPKEIAKTVLELERQAGETAMGTQDLAERERMATEAYTGAAMAGAEQFNVDALEGLLQEVRSRSGG